MSSPVSSFPAEVALNPSEARQRNVASWAVTAGTTISRAAPGATSSSAMTVPTSSSAERTPTNEYRDQTRPCSADSSRKVPGPPASLRYTPTGVSPYAVRVEDLSITYRTTFERKPTLKQAIVRLGRGQRAVREVQALKHVSFDVMGHIPTYWLITRTEGCSAVCGLEPMVGLELVHCEGLWFNDRSMGLSAYV